MPAKIITYAIVNRISGKVVCSGLTYEEAQEELAKFRKISPDAERLYMIVPQSHQSSSAIPRAPIVNNGQSLQSKIHQKTDR